MGLLLVREDSHGEGLGREIYESGERLIRKLWPEVARFRLAVALSNDVTGFWNRMGFHDTGERKPDLEHGIEALLMEKLFSE